MKKATSFEKAKVFLSFMSVAMFFLMGAVDTNSSAYKAGKIFGAIFWTALIVLIIKKLLRR